MRWHDSQVERNSSGDEADRTKVMETQAWRQLDDSYVVDASVRPDGQATGNLASEHAPHRSFLRRSNADTLLLCATLYSLLSTFATSCDPLPTVANCDSTPK